MSHIKSTAPEPKILISLDLAVPRMPSTERRIVGASDYFRIRTKEGAFLVEARHLVPSL